MPPNYDFLSFKCVAENLTLPSSCCFCPKKKLFCEKPLKKKKEPAMIIYQLDLLSSSNNI